MKKILCTALIGAVLAISGCKTTTTTSLPAGAPDAVDAAANEILQPAHAFASAITAAVQSSDPNVHITLTVQQKSVLETLNTSLNIADSLEIAYHAAPNPANIAALKAVTATVGTNLTAAQAVITVTK